MRKITFLQVLFNICVILAISLIAFQIHKPEFPLTTIVLGALYGYFSVDINKKLFGKGKNT